MPPEQSTVLGAILLVLLSASARTLSRAPRTDADGIWVAQTTTAPTPSRRSAPPHPTVVSGDGGSENVPRGCLGTGHERRSVGRGCRHSSSRCGTPRPRRGRTHSRGVGQEFSGRAAASADRSDGAAFRRHIGLLERRLPLVPFPAGGDLDAVLEIEELRPRGSVEILRGLQVRPVV